MYQVNEKSELLIVRREAGFDRACEAAQSLAVCRFGVDDCGHMQNVEGFVRSTDSIQVQFVGYSCSAGTGRQEHVYVFVTWVDRHVDQDDTPPPLVDGLRPSDEELKTWSQEDLETHLSNEVYHAAQLIERLEGAGRVWGNGHHGMQAVAAAAVKELQSRWRVTHVPSE